MKTLILISLTTISLLAAGCVEDDETAVPQTAGAMQFESDAGETDPPDKDTGQNKQADNDNQNIPVDRQP